VGKLIRSLSAFKNPSTILLPRFSRTHSSELIIPSTLKLFPFTKLLKELLGNGITHCSLFLSLSYSLRCVSPLYHNHNFIVLPAREETVFRNSTIKERTRERERRQTSGGQSSCCCGYIEEKCNNSIICFQSDEH
jgi:hypothetical protein